MRKVRFAMLALALCVGTATMARAQGGGGGRGGRGGVAALLRDITLTTDQQAKVDEINKKYMEKNAGLREKIQAGDEDARKEMTANREAMQKEVRELLTDDQKKVFDQHVEEMRSRMSRPPGSL